MAIINGDNNNNILNGTIGNDVIHGLSGNDIINGGGGAHDELFGDDGNDFIDAINGGNHLLDGGSGDDQLFGGNGNDTLKGGTGNDLMQGGSSDDTYVVDRSGDSIIELANGGIDLVRSTALAFTLPSNVENLDLLEESLVGNTGIGNELRNIMDGNSKGNTLRGLDGDDILNGKGGNDVLEGGEGNDKLIGGFGDDTFNGGNGFDTLNEDATFVNLKSLNLKLTNTTLTGLGNDTFQNIEKVVLDAFNPFISSVFASDGSTLDASAFTLGTVELRGGNADDTLLGGSKDDFLDGRAGNDTLNGGAGNDTLDGGIGASVGGSAEDTLDGGSGDDFLRGNDGNDQLTGGAGNDTIDGGDGNDTLRESGNFNFVLTNNQLIGNGTDTLFSIEQVVLTGGNSNNTLDASAFTLGFVSLRGGDGNDTLKGGSQGSSFDGGSGADLMIGGNGNDIYKVDNLGDQIVDTGGIDQVIASINFTLGANLENLTLFGNNLKGTGNSLDNILTSGGNNTLFGGAGKDTLIGDLGKDTLLGGAGDDTLNGGAENDVLAGGAGNDFLTGGAGNNQFVFNTGAAFNPADLGIDTISDFVSGAQKIVLDKTTFTTISSNNGTGFSQANEFQSVTTDAAAATSVADIVYNQSNGKLFYNQNGNAAGFGNGGQFAEVRFTSFNKFLSASDFILQSGSTLGLDNIPTLNGTNKADILTGKDIRWHPQRLWRQ